jgi:hypothetical protein
MENMYPEPVFKHHCISGEEKGAIPHFKVNALRFTPLGRWYTVLLYPHPLTVSYSISTPNPVIELNAASDGNPNAMLAPRKTALDKPPGARDTLKL